MRAPIYEFLKSYSESCVTRFHMPGHKGGKIAFSDEIYDITEIDGADELFAPSGIIEESERNLSLLFNTGKSLYSTEGSTLAIKAMLATALYGKTRNKRPLLLAGRNAHKALIYSAALLDFDIEWFGVGSEDLCSLSVDLNLLSQAIKESKPDAVYVTSPDYLGNILDIGAIARLCHENNIPLLVDNAHGAYLNFLENNLHPIANGADMCADSAHKTLPVLTPGAYLHIAKGREDYMERAKDMMEAFATSSPSYLCLGSLDKVNLYLASEYKGLLSDAVSSVSDLKKRFRDMGIGVLDNEPLKITIDAHSIGYKGYDLAEILRRGSIECEFSDERYLVLMLNENNSKDDFCRLYKVISEIKMQNSIKNDKTVVSTGKRAMSIRDAFLSPSESVAIENALGRILASPSVGCPPAIPIAVMGEVINEDHVKLFKKYGRSFVRVVKSED